MIWHDEETIKKEKRKVKGNIFQIKTTTYKYVNCPICNKRISIN